MWNPGVLVLLAVFATALIGCIGLVMTQRWHGWLSLDYDLNGIQKIHTSPVPRIGGVALFAALLVGGFGALWIDEPNAPLIFTLLACSLPVFLAGLIEDITKRVGVRTRLYASFVAALLAVWFLNANLTRLDTPVLDLLIVLAPISVLFTCFSVGGLTNAVNIIDGINGLAAGSVVLMLAGLSCLAWFQNDILVVQLCAVGMAALLGFLALNYPNGKIFLGDGGAYLTGFWLAECAVLLLARNASVSTWAVLLICFYPVWETVFSMVRRRLRRVDSQQPDQIHLHHLLLNRLRPHPGTGLRATWKGHAITSLLIWSLVVTCQLLVLILVLGHSYSDTLMMGGMTWFAMTYGWLYWSAVSARRLSDEDVRLNAPLY